MRDVVETLTIYLLADELGVDLEELDLTFDDAGFDELLDSLVESLGLPTDDVESVDFGGVEELTAGLGEAVSFLQEQIDNLGKAVFARSDRAVVVPPGTYTLPNGITAIEAQSWGQIKKAFSR